VDEALLTAVERVRADVCQDCRWGDLYVDRQPAWPIEPVLSPGSRKKDEVLVNGLGRDEHHWFQTGMPSEVRSWMLWPVVRFLIQFTSM
jgi:hypothetical protein